MAGWEVAVEVEEEDDDDDMEQEDDEEMEDADADDAEDDTDDEDDDDEPAREDDAQPDSVIEADASFVVLSVSWAPCGGAASRRTLFRARSSSSRAVASLLHCWFSFRSESTCLPSERRESGV